MLKFKARTIADKIFFVKS